MQADEAAADELHFRLHANKQSDLLARINAIVCPKGGVVDIPLASYKDESDDEDIAVLRASAAAPSKERVKKLQQLFGSASVHSSDSEDDDVEMKQSEEDRQLIEGARYMYDTLEASRQKQAKAGATRKRKAPT